MSSQKSQKNAQASYTLQDLLKGKNLEAISAALLLIGKLKVDSVLVYRSSPVIEVTLLGKFKSVDDQKVNHLAEFLDNHGDMTLDDIMKAIGSMSKKRRR